LRVTELPAGATSEVGRLLSHWQQALGLVAWESRIEPVSALQVCDEEGCPGQELVGVVIERPVFTIVHTRPLDEHDIIHELLHVAFPQWDHRRVEIWTELLHFRAIHNERPFDHSKEINQ
jgi:hypothetical protein